MHIKRSRFVAAAVSVLAMFATAHSASAISLYLIDSGVQAYFGSQGAGYEASDPVGSTWTAPGAGPYTPGSPLPNLPAVPTPIVFPSPQGNTFGGPTGDTSTFNDAFVGGPTTATSNIAANFNASPTVVSDAYISIPSWNLTQSPTAPSYAYDQLNFVADYGVYDPSLNLLGSTPSIPLLVSGTVSPSTGSYTQFDAQFTYTWVPTNNTAYSPTGPAVTLGTLAYTYQSFGGGPFSQTINSTGSLLAAPSNWGLLEITGYAYLAGDPSSISISAPVPEPSSLGILTIGLAAMGRRWRRGQV